jgi:hypothetical protein
MITPNIPLTPQAFRWQSLEREWFALVPTPGHKLMETSHCFYIMRMAYNHLAQRFLTQLPLVGYKSNSRIIPEDVDPLWIAQLICLMMVVIEKRGDLPSHLESQYGLIYLNLLKHFANFKELRQKMDLPTETA